jgi:Polyketide cyclase / dehydrase and lipid transport.
MQSSKRMTSRRGLIIACLLSVAIGAKSFGASIEAKVVSERDTLPSRDLSGLYGTQRAVAFSVDDYVAPNGTKWIRLASIYESAYRASMSDIVGTLWDFKAAPSIFPRIAEVRVRSSRGNEAVTEQRTSVNLLGFSYVTTQVLQNELLKPAPRTAEITFKSIESDESTLSTEGGWSLEDRSDASGPATYVRYSLETYVAPKYPAQAFLMRQFGGADMKATLKQLGDALAARGYSR